jgi:hypothetical protein
LILRCTSRMLDVLGGKPTLVESAPNHDDWYANVVFVEGKKCVLLTHVGTLFFPVSLDVEVGLLRPVGGFVYTQIGRALEREGLPRDALAPIDDKDVSLARTADRSVLGSMNDMVQMTRHIICSRGGLGQINASTLNEALHPNGAHGFPTPLELVGQRTAARPGVKSLGSE